MAIISETIEFETIERIREQEDDTVLLMEQHALAAFEIADFCTCGVWQAQHAGRCTQAARRVLRHRSRPGRPVVKAIVYDLVGAPALVRDVAEPDCPEDGAVITVQATAYAGRTGTPGVAMRRCGCHAFRDTSSPA